MQVEFLAQPTHALKEVYLTLTMQVLVELEHLVKWLDSCPKSTATGVSKKKEVEDVQAHVCLPCQYNSEVNGYDVRRTV